MSATVSWDRDSINDLLLRNNRAVERALVALHDLQTNAERSSKTTTEANGVGFGAFDAEIMSSLAEAVKRGYSLSERQLAICRKTNKQGFCRLGRYWKQLVAIIPAGAPAPKVQTPAAPVPVPQVQAPQAVAADFEAW